MDLFEYQGKQYFARFGIPVSPGRRGRHGRRGRGRGRPAGYPVVVKAQVQVGGRGKAGGIKLANDADEVRTHAGEHPRAWTSRATSCERVWVEHASDIAEEYYARFTLDRSAKQHLLMLSAQGGVEIEEVAAEDPDAIVRLHIDPVDGLAEATGAGRGRGRRTQPRRRSTARPTILLKLYRCYTEGDCDLAEINPLILKPTARSTPSTPRSPSTTTPSSAIPSGRSSRPPRSSTSGSAWPGRRASSTSVSTARSASSPTAPGWP